jgi:hypothetical protein
VRADLLNRKSRESVQHQRRRYLGAKLFQQSLEVLESLRDVGLSGGIIARRQLQLTE